MKIPLKNKNGSALSPSDYTSGNLSKDTRNTGSKEYKHPYVHCSIIYNDQYLEATQVSISRRVDKTNLVHLHSGILLSCKKKKKKKKKNLPLCQHDGPGEHYDK